jgi:hypothetical protein
VKNPNDPTWARDPATRLYRQIMRRHYPSGRVSDVYHWYGMTVAWTMVETLRRAGRNLTRAGLLRPAQSLDVGNNPFLLPGIRLKTSRSLYYRSARSTSTATTTGSGFGPAACSRRADDGRSTLSLRGTSNRSHPRYSRGGDQ